MDQLLIIGGGLAGTVLALECKTRGIDFRWIITDEIPASSSAAYGMCNPVHLRNQVPVWKAELLLNTSLSFFKSWSEKLGPSFFFPMPVNHLVADNDELVRWRQNSESTELWKFTNGEPQHNFHHLLNDDFIAEINIRVSFFVNIPALVKQAREYLHPHIENRMFDVNVEGREPNRKMVFADGISGSENPFFSYVPFNPCKGQILMVRIPGLDLSEAIHKRIVLVPLEDDSYLCGATYEWNDLSFHTTESGKQELLGQLDEILGRKYKVEVIGQKAGVRPAISDRRPVVGWHPIFPNVGILNGFGTRGLLLAPSTAINLLNSMMKLEDIVEDWDIKRFNKRFHKKLEQEMKS